MSLLTGTTLGRPTSIPNGSYVLILRGKQDILNITHTAHWMKEVNGPLSWPRDESRRARIQQVFIPCQVHHTLQDKGAYSSVQTRCDTGSAHLPPLLPNGVPEPFTKVTDAKNRLES